ncbi:hypothetical protein N7535_003449 [Penicillium sp. DV-2018c]|nr:hypothetical protein N7535_003449 [Penicillium sp. DV-2018c]
MHLGGLPPRHSGPPLAPGQVAEMLCQLLGDHRRTTPSPGSWSHNPVPWELANLTPTVTSFSSGSKIHQTKRAKQASKGGASGGIPQRFTDGKWIVLKPASGFKPHENSFLHVVKYVGSVSQKSRRGGAPSNPDNAKGLTPLAEAQTATEFIPENEDVDMDADEKANPFSTRSRSRLVQNSTRPDLSLPGSWEEDAEDARVRKDKLARRVESKDKRKAGIAAKQAEVDAAIADGVLPEESCVHCGGPHFRRACQATPEVRDAYNAEAAEAAAAAKAEGVITDGIPASETEAERPPGAATKEEISAGRGSVSSTPSVASLSSGSKLRQTKRAKQASKGGESDGIPQRFT